MSSILYRSNHVLSRVVADVALGTNLGLCHLLWTLLSGRLLQSRGALIPALADCGRGAAAVRRAWAALAYGCWHTARLLAAWQRAVQDDGRWQAHRHGGGCHEPGAPLWGGRWRWHCCTTAWTQYAPGKGWHPVCQDQPAGAGPQRTRDGDRHVPGDGHDVLAAAGGGGAGGCR
jgi:hypothetical protein